MIVHYTDDARVEQEAGHLFTVQYSCAYNVVLLYLICFEFYVVSLFSIYMYSAIQLLAASMLSYAIVIVINSFNQ